MNTNKETGEGKKKRLSVRTFANGVTVRFHNRRISVVKRADGANAIEIVAVGKEFLPTKKEAKKPAITIIRNKIVVSGTALSDEAIEALLNALFYYQTEITKTLNTSI